MKAKSWTWSDVVKGLKIEDELETTNSNKSWNVSDSANSVEQFDLEESDEERLVRPEMDRRIGSMGTERLLEAYAPGQ